MRISKEKLKQRNNGITLVALVVTIVVLLILAGITINALLGQNSIFDLAREAANRTNEAVENEQRELGNLINYINDQGWGSSTGGNENVEFTVVAGKNSMQINTTNVGEQFVEYRYHCDSKD